MKKDDGSSRWFEHPSQFLLGAVETTLHGSQGQVEDLRYFAARSVLHVPQGEAA